MEKCENEQEATPNPQQPQLSQPPVQVQQPDTTKGEKGEMPDTGETNIVKGDIQVDNVESDSGSGGSSDDGAKDMQRKNRKRKTREEEDGAEVCFVCADEEGKVASNNKQDPNSSECNKCDHNEHAGSDVCSNQVNECCADHDNSAGHKVDNASVTSEERRSSTDEVIYVLFVHLRALAMRECVGACDCAYGVHINSYNTVQSRVYITTYASYIVHIIPYNLRVHVV